MNQYAKSIFARHTQNHIFYGYNTPTPYGYSKVGGAEDTSHYQKCNNIL